MQICGRLTAVFVGTLEEVMVLELDLNVRGLTKAALDRLGLIREKDVLITIERLKGGKNHGESKKSEAKTGSGS